MNSKTLWIKDDDGAAGKFWINKNFIYIKRYNQDEYSCEYNMNKNCNEMTKYWYT